MSAEKYALVSTVDTLGPDFPSHCVIIFPTREEALKYAAEILVRYEHTDVTYDEEKGVWSIEDVDYEDVEDLINEWQLELDSTEYFHIMPIASEDAFIGGSVAVASEPTTFKEPFLSRVRDAAEDAQGICWDGCHKIYVLADRRTCEKFGEIGYQVFPAENLDRVMRELYQWFDLSCSLRFIDKVSNSNEYVGLINQCEYDEEPQETS